MWRRSCFVVLVAFAVVAFPGRATARTGGGDAGADGVAAREGCPRQVWTVRVVRPEPAVRGTTLGIDFELVTIGEEDPRLPGCNQHTCGGVGPHGEALWEPTEFLDHCFVHRRRFLTVCWSTPCFRHP